MRSLKFQDSPSNETLSLRLLFYSYLTTHDKCLATPILPAPFNLLCLSLSVTWQNNNKHTPWAESASELYRPSDRRLSTKLVPTFADTGCYVVSVMVPYCRMLVLLDRSSYISFQVSPQLYSRGWVDPVPDPLLLRKSGSYGNRTLSFQRLANHYTEWAMSNLRYKFQCINL
jgi:hypothetical protein